jgi:hypothetical protein
MTRRQFLNRWRGLYDSGALMTVRDGRQVFQVGGGWAVVVLAPPPPPHPRDPLAASAELPEAVNFGVRPQPPAARAVPPAPVGENFGVDGQKLRDAHRKFSLNGTEVSRAVAYAAVLADDSDRHHLTFVGVPVPATLPAAVRDAAHVQAYQPGDWAVSRFALTPGVTLRRPATDRVGVEVLHLAAYDTDAVLAAMTGHAPPRPPAPTLGAVTLTLADLTATARARLDAAGVAELVVSVTPKAISTPMPGKPAVAATPAYPAPPGPGWAWRDHHWERPLPPNCAGGTCPRR